MRCIRKRSLARAHLHLALEMARRQSCQGTPGTRLRWWLLRVGLRCRLQLLALADELRQLDRQALVGWQRLRHRGDICPIRRGQATVERSTPCLQYRPGRR